MIVAPAATGKSDLAHALAGVTSLKNSDNLTVAGRPLSRLSLRERARAVGFVPTDPTLLFSCIADTLRRELELGLEFLGEPAQPEWIEELNSQLDVSHLEHRNPLTLSGGERVRAGLALALVKRPSLLVLDDVFVQLDPQSISRVREVIDRQRTNSQLAVIELHSRAPTQASQRNVEWLFLTEKGIIAGPLTECWEQVAAADPDLLPSLPRLGTMIQRRTAVAYASPPATAEEVIHPLRLERIDTEPLRRASLVSPRDDAGITIRQLGFRYQESQDFRLGPITHSFPRSTITALLGRNGAGKTTLLRCIGNLYSTWSGETEIGDFRLSKDDPLHAWAHHVLYSFQNPDDQLFLPTVLEELSETTRRIRDKTFPVDERVKHVANVLGLEPTLGQSPWDLPRPFRRLVCIGSALVAAPYALLLDEPTAGLDRQQVDSVTAALRTYRDGGGTLVLISHDPDFISELADELIVLDAGQIVATANSQADCDSWPIGAMPATVSVSRALGTSPPLWRENDLLEEIVRLSSQRSD